VQAALRIIDPGSGEDRTAAWFGAERPPTALPARCLAAADLDRDGRLDILIGCGSDDPFETHADVALLQVAAGRFEARLLVGDGGEERGTRRVVEESDARLLDRGSAFPNALPSPWRRLPE
jgi:hypothetical protein